VGLVATMVILLTTIGFNVESAPRAAAATSFNCQPGDIYSMQSGGDIKYINAAGTVSTFYTADAATKPSSGQSMNGLGIGAGGTTAYWYERTGTGASDIARILQFQNGTVTSPGGAHTTEGNDNNTALVAGAVDLSNGNFLYGYFDATPNFHLFLWNPVSKAYSAVGYTSFALSGVSNQALNGDMVFDSQGTLYILGSTNPSSGNITLGIYVITAANLQSAISHPSVRQRVTASLGTSKTISAASGFNGIAFGGNGYVYVGNSTNLYRYDPSTWQLVGANPVTTGLANS
jgi:hypothetical protein